MQIHDMRPNPRNTQTTTATGVDFPTATVTTLRLAPPTVAGGSVRPGGGRHRCDRPRTLHLVDLENLLAGRVDTRSVTDIWREYRQVTGMRWDDHVIVSVAKKNAATTFFALPETVQRVIGRNEPDGADLALIDAVDIEWAARQFGQVMVATGDGIFTDIAARLHTQGLQVVQVIGGGLPATGLYRQCPAHLYLTAAQRRVQTRRHAELTAAMAEQAA